MASVGIGLLVFFIKKQWIFEHKKDDQNRLHPEDKEPSDNQKSNGRVEYHVWKREK